MYMESCAWDKAYDTFFDAFRCYQESGNARAKICLKYVVLASMIALSEINPLDSREAKVYSNDSEVKAILDLRSAFESGDAVGFERVLRDPANRILSDPFMNKYVNDLLRTLRSQILTRLIEPYERVPVSKLARGINVDAQEAESLLVELILDEKINCKISQVDGVVVKVEQTSADASADQWTSMGKWIDSIEKTDVLHRVRNVGKMMRGVRL